jgi:hypothetical protein
MPNAKDNAKLTGDTHLPDVGDETAQAAEGQEQDEQRNSAGQGGQIKDKEAPTSNSYGNTRDSGERPK